MTPRAAALAASFIAAALAAPSPRAAPVYRCGNTYTSIPCPEGGRVVDATDPRSAAQRAEAKRVEAREREQAAQMKKDRLAAEAHQNPAMVSGFDSRASATPAATASAPAKGKTKKGSTKKDAKGTDASSDFNAVDPTTSGRRKSH